jgi:hypothetical protein
MFEKSTTSTVASTLSCGKVDEGGRGREGADMIQVLLSSSLELDGVVSR